MKLLKNQKDVPALMNRQQAARFIEYWINLNQRTYSPNLREIILNFAESGRICGKSTIVNQGGELFYSKRRLKRWLRQIAKTYAPKPTRRTA